MNIVTHGNGKEFRGFTVRASPWGTDRVDIFLIRAPGGVEIRLISHSGTCYTHYLKFDFYNQRKWESKYSNILEYMVVLLSEKDVEEYFDNCDNIAEFKRTVEIVRSQITSADVKLITQWEKA